MASRVRFIDKINSDNEGEYSGIIWEDREDAADELYYAKRDDGDWFILYIEEI